MKRFLGLFAALSLVIGSFIGLGLPQPASAAGLSSVALRSGPMVLAEIPRNSAEEKLDVPFGESIDLNNTNIRAFTNFPGMYPTIARKIIANAPYEKTEDIYDIPGLSDREKEIIDMHFDKFRITEPEDALVEGGDRFNNGIYK